MADVEVVDGKYYEVAGPGTLAERLVVRARDRIYADFLTEMRPGPLSTILDVGVSDVVGEAANVLERKYPYLDRITAVGLGVATTFRATFPSVVYRQIEPGDPLPFPDRSFDIATSNAVLEHVGSAQEQERLVKELLRVARAVFITVPHRMFPVEHHTAIPLLHWWDPTLRVACQALRKERWAEPANLILMSRATLERLKPAGRNARVGYTGIRLGPFSSNLFLSAGPPRRADETSRCAAPAATPRRPRRHR